MSVVHFFVLNSKKQVKRWLDGFEKECKWNKQKMIKPAHVLKKGSYCCVILLS